MSAYLSEKVSSLLNQSQPKPYSLNAKDAAVEAYDHLRCHHYLNESVALVKLLAKPHIKSLLLCHDVVANKAYLPTISPVQPVMDDPDDDDDMVVKVVTLIKGLKPLGLTMKVNESTGSMTVAQVVPGSVADRCGAIDVGDEVVEVNEVLVGCGTLVHVVNDLTTTKDTVKLKLIPVHPCLRETCPTDSVGQEIYVRTLSAYNPSTDPKLSNTNAGLPFEPGEILRVTNFADPHWLEATKVEMILKGPIASGFVTSRYQMVFGQSGLIHRTPLMLENPTSEDTPSTEQPVNKSPPLYEEVVRYYPEDGLYRPIVFIGPPGVGKTELLRQFINTDPFHFREPICITTRSSKPGERYGVPMLHVTNEEFDTFIEADSLVDYSTEPCGARTGLCVDAVLEVIQAGHVACFEVHYGNLHLVRSPILKPLIVFVKPPCLELFLETRQSRAPGSECMSSSLPSPLAVHSVPSTPRIEPVRPSERTSGASTPTHTTTFFRNKLEDMSSGFRQVAQLPRSSSARGTLKESEVHEMLQISAELERTHQHYADFVLVNDDLPVALERLSEWAYRIEDEATWVPRQWVESTVECTLDGMNNDPLLTV